ncbi:hypothetical protein RI065_06380 [Mycoplasmatota bacterium zrk1]
MSAKIISKQEVDDKYTEPYKYQYDLVFEYENFISRKRSITLSDTLNVIVESETSKVNIKNIYIDDFSLNIGHMHGEFEIIIENRDGVEEMIPVCYIVRIEANNYHFNNFNISVRSWNYNNGRLSILFQSKVDVVKT